MRIGGSVRRRFETLLFAVGAVAALATLATPAAAVDHNIRIRDVFAGASTMQTGARFVELQMASGNQTQVAGNKLHVYNAAGASVGVFTFPATLANGAAQSSILVATGQAETFFGVPADLTMTAVIPRTGGQVCYEDADLDSGNPPAFRDCVAWGGFTGASPSPTGNPFGPIGGIVDGMSILRDISAGNPNLLELADDTDDSAADFDTAFPVPENNAGTTTTTAGTASVDGAGELDFTAAPGIKNRVTVVDSGAFWRLTDTSAPVTAVAPCEQVFVNRVRCPQSAVTSLNLVGDDLNDQLTTPDGIDVILDGGAGDDILTAKNGTDDLLGGIGRDILDGGFGPDVLDGGDNQDSVTYERRTAAQPVTVDLDGAPGDDGGVEDDDGAGVRDTVMGNVENLKGGAAADVLTGNDSSNKLLGNGADDELHGLGANDEIRAKDGAIDTITCGAGPSDVLFANGNDIFPVAGPDACELVS